MKLISRHAVLSLLALTLASAAQADLTLPKDADDLFVRFDASLTNAQQSVLLAKNGLRIEWRSNLVPGLVRAKSLNGGNVHAIATQVSRLNTNAGILYAEPNYKQYRKLDPAPKAIPARAGGFSAGPTDPMFSRQWALTSENGVNPSGAWEKTTGSREVKVAILDTGIQADHVELSDRVLPGYDFIGRKDQVVDTHGHGTHVSGIIGARWDNGAGIAGINKDVSFIPVRVVPDDGDETDANLVEAFEFAVQQGARVANCSFGKAESGTAVKDVIEAAGQHGLLVIVAAGNDSKDIGRSPAYPASFQTSNMIIVASNNSRGTLSFFSNFSAQYVNIAAPGSGILSSVTPNSYASWDGTSMATPQVVGVAALVLSANPSLTVSQLKDVLLSTAASRPSLVGKITTGGLVDATAAVNKALTITDEIPAPTPAPAEVDAIL